MKRVGKILLAIFGGLLSLVLTVGAGVYLLNRHPLPASTSGAAAEALADRIETTIGCAAWKELPAVAFRLGGREHLWDKARGLAQVRFGGRDVRLVLNDKRGRAFVDGREIVDAAERQALVERAYAWWANDSFWMNPLCKLHDDGTERALATIDGRPALSIHYRSGGVTPGDRYLWIVDENGRPIAWRLYVRVLPIPGVELSWEGWTTVGGVQLSTVHRDRFGLPVVQIRDLRAGNTVELAGGQDPFAGL